MSSPNSHPIHPLAEKLARPFLDELAQKFSSRMRSLYLTGSAVTPDFHERASDVNTLLVLREISFDLLDEIAQMGRKYGKRRIRAPLVLTLEEILRLLDVFPIEILDLKLVSHLAKGEDVLSGLQVDRAKMRVQCERELRGRVVRLRQEYVRALSEPKLLRSAMVGSVSGLMALLRGTLFALGRETPLGRAEVLAALREAAGADVAPLEAVLALKAGGVPTTRPTRSLAQISERSLLQEYCATMAKLSEVIDAAV